VVVLVVARQPRRHLVEAQLGEYRDTVEGLLPVHRNIVPEGLEGLARERLVDAFGFLQADHVRIAFLEPGDDIVDALLDGIDVPGRNSHFAPRVSWRGRPAGALAAVLAGGRYRILRRQTSPDGNGEETDGGQYIHNFMRLQASARCTRGAECVKKNGKSCCER